MWLENDNDNNMILNLAFHHMFFPRLYLVHFIHRMHCYTELLNGISNNSSFDTAFGPTSNIVYVTKSFKKHSFDTRLLLNNGSTKQSLQRTNSTSSPATTPLTVQKELQL